MAGTVIDSLIYGLNEKMIQERVNSIDARPFLFGKHFPIKKIVGFDWKTVQNQLAKKNVAADIHSDNSSIVRKRRPVFESARGDVPYIAISREWTRSEMKAYQTAKALAQNPTADALVDYWGNDVDFCYNGVQSELEYIAWALFSNAGKLAFTTGNNATFQNEYDLDYDVDDDKKVVTSTDWADKGNADIIGDLATIVKNAKAQNLNPKFAFVNLDELYKITSSEQVIKKCASVAANLMGTQSTPDLATLNAMLAREAWLNGLQLRVIDQTITREHADESKDTSGNPFANNRLILSESEILGSTQYDVLNEAQPNIMRAVRSHTVIKKYATAEPSTEITIGQADAIPVFDTAYRTVFVKTDKKAWE